MEDNTWQIRESAKDTSPKLLKLHGRKQPVLEIDAQDPRASRRHHVLGLVLFHGVCLGTPIPLDAHDGPRALALQVHNHKQLGDLHPRPAAVEMNLEFARLVRALRVHEPLVVDAVREEPHDEAVDLLGAQEHVPGDGAYVGRVGEGGDLHVGGEDAVHGDDAGLHPGDWDPDALDLQDGDCFLLFLLLGSLLGVLIGAELRGLGRALLWCELWRGFVDRAHGW